MVAKHLLVLGPGFTGKAIIGAARQAGYSLSASIRRDDAITDIKAVGAVPVDLRTLTAADMADVTHLLMGIAPSDGDPILRQYHDMIAAAPQLAWIGYLSSTNVYGDHGGGWVDEDTPPTPGLLRGQRRIDAEAAWQQLADRKDIPLSIFRCAGIYGPGRSALDTLRAGRARCIIKPGQIFSRIYVSDIAAAVLAAMQQRPPSRIYNLADSNPAPPQDVIRYGAELLGMAPPPDIPFETADISPMARSFYGESKRVRATRIITELGVTLTYPDYKTGLKAILDAAPS